jgi:hypothetical protein
MQNPSGRINNARVRSPHGRERRRGLSSRFHARDGRSTPVTAHLLPWLLTFASGPAVTVDGAATCPTAADVSARVTELLPAAETSGPPDLARVDEDADSVHVSLRRPDGTLVGTRDLERAFSCDELAAAAAVVVAAWESDVHPEFRASLPPAVPVPAPPVAVVPVAAPVPSIAVAPGLPRPATIAFEVGAALAGALAPRAGSAGAAADVMLVGAATSAARRVGGRLALIAGAARELPVGTGRVRWRRFVAALGPEVRLGRPTAPVTFELHAEALAALLTATGEGFTNDRSELSFDPGLGAGVRLRLGHGRVVPWIDLSGSGWLRQQQAIATPDDASAVLPRFEALLALGLSLFAGS